MTDCRAQIDEMVEDIRYSFDNDREKLLDKIDALMEFSVDNNEYYGISKAHMYLGINSVENGNIHDGISQYVMALSYTYYEGLESIRPLIFNNLGVAQALIGNHIAAIEHFTSAKKLIKEYNCQKDLLPIINGNIADGYLGIHQPKKALEYLDKVNEGVALLSYERAHVILANYAEAYILLKEPDRAFDYILWCEEIVSENSYFIMIPYILFLKAKYFELLNEPKDAELFYQNSLNKQYDSEQFVYYPKISSEYMNFLIDRKKFEACIPLIYKSLEIAEINKWDFVLSDYYGKLSICYEGMHDWENAYKAIKFYYDFENRNKERFNRYQLNLINAQENLMKLETKNNVLIQSIENMKVVNHILKRINSIHNLHDLIRELYSELKNIFELDTFAIAFFDDENEKIVYLEKYENGEHLGPSQIEYSNDKSLSVWVRNNKKPIVIHDSEDYEYLHQNYEKLKIEKSDYKKVGNYSKSVVIWPLMIEDSLIGLINIQALKENSYSSYDLELIEMLSSHLAIAIVNNRQRSELNHMIEKLNKLSYTDSLTGIYNRQAFNQYLPELYKRAITDRQNLVFAMIDLDNFKELNDTFGHQVGDECLSAFGNLLKDVVGELGYAYRYGGDEFSLLFIGIELEVVDSILEEICQRSSQLYALDNKVAVTASLGAVFIEKGQCENISIQSFINYADNALYIAKSEGKNIYRRVII